MSRSRNAYPGSAAGSGSAAERDARQPRRPPVPDGDPAAARPGLRALLVFAGLTAAMLLLGVLSKAGPVARLELRIDQHIAAHDRVPVLTALAKAASTIGSPAVGIGLMVIVPLILVLVRRRLDAVKVFCMFGAAFALAEGAKQVISEHRPPLSIQAMATDATPSYPSGHTTTAAIIAVTFVVIAVTVVGRLTAVVLGGLYTLAVAGSRVYLGDHYPLDVAGSVLCALAAAFLIAGLAALPAVRRRLRRIDAPGG